MKTRTIAIISCIVVFFHVGCSSREARMAKMNIAEAETLISSAKLMGADAKTPETIERAEYYYQLAANTFEKEVEANRMIAYLREDTENKKISAENAAKAIKEAQTAIEIIQSQNAELEARNETLRKKLDKIKTNLDTQSKTRGIPLDESPIEKDASTQYKEAFGQYQEGKFNQSIRIFQKFLDRFPLHELSDNAQYWIGESYYSLKDYEKAKNAFETVIREFENGNKSPDAMLKIGLCYRELGDANRWEISLKEVIDRWPESNAAHLAKKYLEKQ